MNLGRGGKITVGILTAIAALGPVLIVAFAMVMAFSIMFSAVGAEANGEPPALFFLPFGMMFVMVPLQLLFGFLLLGLQVFYFIHLLRHDGAPEIARILLGLGFFFMPYLAMPIYFFLYVWPTPPSEETPAIPKAPPAPALPSAG